MQIIKKGKTIVTTHSFYCDKCSKHIMDSVEYDDGWYNKPQELRSFYLDDYGWFYNNMNLCDTCRQNIILKIKEELEKLGYKIGDE